MRTIIVERSDKLAMKSHQITVQMPAGRDPVQVFFTLYSRPFNWVSYFPCVQNSSNCIFYNLFKQKRVLFDRYLQNLCLYWSLQVLETGSNILKKPFKIFNKKTKYIYFILFYFVHRRFKEGNFKAGVLKQLYSL